MATEHFLTLINNDLSQNLHYIQLVQNYDKQLSILLNITQVQQQQLFSSSLLKYYSDYQLYFRSEYETFGADIIKKAKTVQKPKKVDIIEAAFLAVQSGAYIKNNKLEHTVSRRPTPVTYSQEQFTNIMQKIKNEFIATQVYYFNKMQKFDYYNLSLAVESIEKVKIEVDNPLFDLENFRKILSERILSEMKPQMQNIFQVYKETSAQKNFDYNMLLDCCFCCQVLALLGYGFYEAEKGYKIVVSKNGQIVYTLDE